MSRPPSLPMRFRTSPLKMLLLFLVSLAFVGGGMLMVLDEPIVGYVCIALFGLCAITGAVSLLPGSSYLELTRDGFIVSSLFRKSFTSWEQVNKFLIYRVQHSERVGWNYTLASGEQTIGRRLSTVLAGVEGGLPDTYGMKARELADLMNSIRVLRNNEC